MLHGRVVRPPTISTKPTNVDESSIKNIAGVVKVVQQGCFVGVVAQTEWAAIQASRQLKVTWSAPEHQYPSSKEAIFEYLKNTKSVREQALVSRGDPETAISQASKTFEATYRWPFQLHGMLGPSCSVADVKDNEATIWAGSQSTFRTREQLADLLGLPAKSVRVIYQEGSGSYGRLSIDDVALDAALMSRAVGRPVRVQWMRDDEHAWEPKGPAQLLTVRAAIDASGKVTAWEFTDRSLPRSENGSPFLAARQIGRKPSDVINGNGAAGGGQLYTFENQKIVSATIPWMLPDPMPLRTCNLRAPGDLARTFASESIIDEMAMATGADPVDFRLHYLNDKRVVGVLNAAAKQAQWTPRASARSAASGAKATGRGVAVANRGDTMTACVADVEVDKAKGYVQVKHITLAQDCGFIVNPDGVKNQVEGNVIQAVSRALLEEVKFDASGITTLDWESYPILHFPDAPEIDVVLVNQPTMPSLGTGEPGMVAVPAAIANAISDAIGVRLREVPMTPDRVLTALKSEKVFVG
jgi:CO/xanthine dehydrogenase Mo-binding subunit